MKAKIKLGRFLGSGYMYAWTPTNAKRGDYAWDVDFCYIQWTGKKWIEIDL